MEIWKDIKGYEGLYQVSDCGNVRSVDRFILKKGVKQFLKGKTLKPSIVNQYYSVILSKNNKIKRFSIHRLVYETFIGEIPNGKQVNHINENKTDNKVENLNLMSPKENTNWGTGIERRSKKNSKQVLQIDPATDIIISEFQSASDAERKLGLSQGHISNCCNNKPHCNTCGGYKWQFKKVS